MNKRLYMETLSQSFPFFLKLTENQKQLLEDQAAFISYPKGTLLHSAEYQCVGMLYVKSGSLRVYMLSEDGREITLYRISKGEVCILSASCVLQSITFDVYIDAVMDCEVLQIPSSVILLLMNDNIYVEAFAYKMASERFSDVMWAMQQILFMSFDKRLAIFLLDESASPPFR